MKHIFIINPHSFRASGNLQDVLREIEDCFSDENDDSYKIHISRYPRDAIAVVSEFISDCPKNETVRVYAVGGNGIHFECLNGMIDFPNAELTCVPYGNANDYDRAFGEGLKEKFRDIKSLLSAPSRPVDIINCGSNYAILGLSIGMVGQAIIHANEIFPRLPVKWLRKNIGLAYSLCAVKAMFNKSVTRQHYTILLDGEDFSGQYCNIYVTNIACNGGTLTPSPYAKPDDGKLHVMLLDTRRKRDIVTAIGDFNKGHFEKFEWIHYRTCKVMEIKSEDLLCVEIDGEGFYAREMRIEIVTWGIRFFAPEGLDFADYSGLAYNSANTSPDEKERRA